MSSGNSVSYHLFMYAPVLFAAAIIAFIAYRAFKNRRDEKDKLKEIAFRLGFSFAHETAGEGFLSYISGFHLKGRYNGVDTKIYSKKVSHGRNSSEYTCVDADAEWHSNSEIVITRETGMSRLGISILGMQDLKSGNAELDSLVVIKGVPEHFVKRIVQDSTLQHELVQLFQLKGQIYVDRKGAHYETGGVMMDEQYLRKLLDHLTRTATALGSASE